MKLFAPLIFEFCLKSLKSFFLLTLFLLLLLSCEDVIDEDVLLFLVIFEFFIYFIEERKFDFELFLLGFNELLFLFFLFPQNTKELFLFNNLLTFGFLLLTFKVPLILCLCLVLTKSSVVTLFILY